MASKNENQNHNFLTCATIKSPKDHGRPRSSSAANPTASLRRTMRNATSRAICSSDVRGRKPSILFFKPSDDGSGLPGGGEGGVSVDANACMDSRCSVAFVWCCGCGRISPECHRDPKRTLEFDTRPFGSPQGVGNDAARRGPRCGTPCQDDTN